MQTLTYGLERPDNLDRGDIFFEALFNNITKNDVHTHNGVNSPLIPVDSFQKLSVSIPGTGWTAIGNGYFKRTVTMPGSFLYGQAQIAVYGASGPNQDRRFYPDFTKLTNTTFEIKMMVPDQALTLSFV